jgi:lipoprotein-anchoring transpeptidase ErfK/SrfK
LTSTGRVINTKIYFHFKGWVILENNKEKLGDNHKVRKSIKEKLKKNRKKIIIILAIFLCTLLIIYFGTAIYFMNRYYYGSEINGIDVSLKPVNEVMEQLESQLQTYKLNITERGGRVEQIMAADIGLKYNPENAFQSFKDGQNPFNWLSSLFNEEGYKLTVGTSYDEKMLKEQIDSLQCFDDSNIVEPKNASIKYEGNSYVIVDEINGAKVDKDILFMHAKETVDKKETTIDLEAIDSYIKPQYTSKSQKIIKARDILNKYVSTKITYTFGENEEVVDASIISDWLSVDDNYKVTFTEEKVKEYVDELAEKYNTLGKSKKFVTTAGKTISIKRGDYGWSINKTKETEFLTEAIKEGLIETKEPAYNQTALSHASNGIGNTYVEVDMANQHLWFYKNGKLVVDGPVVTGNVSRGYTTPEGVYRLKYKTRDAVLRGEDYASPVSFWMPFNGGIGLHDASWRSVFGGRIYRTNGSHGCINMQYKVVEVVYNNIRTGTPVICHNNR